MGYLGRRIGLSQDQGDSNPGAAGGAVGGGLLDLFTHGYFERQGDIYNAPGVAPPPGAPLGMTASGGVISDYVSGPLVYRAHIFTSSGALNVTALSASLPNNLEYLVVAGGGGGGGSRDNYAGQGGGGAGGLRTNIPGVSTPGPSPNPNVPLTSSSTFAVAQGGTYPVVVGAGGVGGQYPANGFGGNGNPSVLTHTSAPNTITSTGGGAGAGGLPESGNAATGGSGGGGSGYYKIPGGAGNTPSTSPIQGHAGGAGTPNSGPQSSGGGGGGAGGVGEVGSDNNSSRGAYGGLGVPVSITGVDVTYAGGGGAGMYFNPNTTQWASNAPQNGGGGGSGGLGGGTAKSQTQGQPGTPGTGGGGGGATAHNPSGGPRNGGTGGGGVVIVRYQIGQVATATAKATGGVISYYNNKTIHTFNSNGTFATTSDWDAGTDEVEYVCVGGGGGGGGTDPNCWGAGGGGAGQLKSGTTTISHPSPFSVVIGAGGGGGVKYDAVSSNPGSNTTVSFPAAGLTAHGGGSGSSNAPSTQTTGGNGLNYPSTPSGSGSGGGGSKAGTAGSGGPAALGAYPGGNSGPGNGYVGGGGGGAGGVGQAGSPDSPQSAPQIASYGAGGVGKEVPATFQNPAVSYDGVHTGGQFFLAGGGGGGLFNPSPYVNPDRGGKGGGGQGGGGSPGNSGSRGLPGATNTGGGGGGSGSYNDATVFYGGHGGSGIVLIAYPS